VSAPTPQELYRAAKAYIKAGQPVFPCRPVGEKAKAPYTRRGLHDATLDLNTVKQWWRQRGDAAIGIPTGIKWDVLDVDSKGEHDGRVHLPYLNRLGLLNGCQRVAKTPSGGWHLYFKAAPALTNSVNQYLGLDKRGVGGYVLAAPSFVDDGEKSVGCYEDHGPTKGHTDEPLLWDLIVSALRPTDETTKQPIAMLGYERQSSLASLRGWLSERQAGERNNALHWAVCRCIDNGIDPHELVEVALYIGLAEDEVLLTVNSALKRAGLSADELDSEAEAMFGND
jgi:hypothetical protein